VDSVNVAEFIIDDAGSVDEIVAIETVLIQGEGLLDTLSGSLLHWPRDRVIGRERFGGGERAGEGNEPVGIAEMAIGGGLLHAFDPSGAKLFSEVGTFLGDDAEEGVIEPDDEIDGGLYRLGVIE
jgi:hypothetical protein